jgi:hypothetical protein
MHNEKVQDVIPAIGYEVIKLDPPITSSSSGD